MLHRSLCCSLALSCPSRSVHYLAGTQRSNLPSAVFSHGFPWPCAFFGPFAVNLPHRAYLLIGWSPISPWCIKTHAPETPLSFYRMVCTVLCSLFLPITAYKKQRSQGEPPFVTAQRDESILQRSINIIHGRGVRGPPFSAASTWRLSSP